MDELKELEQKAWLALQRGHYKVFGKIAAKWKKVREVNGLKQDDPFEVLRQIAHKVRV